MLEQLKARYDQYEHEAQQAREKASGFDGLFGMGADPRKYPCHDRFYEDVQAWTEEFLKGNPDAAQAGAAAEWILRAADSRRGEETYWYLYAAQKHACALIGRMEPEQCGVLARWYDGAYPAIDRMPVQREVFKLLRERAKAKK